MVQTDPTTVATIWHFLKRVCREMRETTERTAANVLIVTLHDIGYGIWDARAGLWLSLKVYRAGW